MKVSLRWIFDHIDASYSSVNLDQFFALFNAKTAECEGMHSFKIPANSYAFAVVTSVEGDTLHLDIPEWSKKVSLPARSLAAAAQIPAGYVQGFIIHADVKHMRYATCADWGLEKDGALPLMTIPQNELDGGWKKKVEWDDVLLDVDNKSLTHRPDMWGHRGFAREVAALLDLPFKKEETFLAPLTTHALEGAEIQDKGWTIKRQAPEANPFFAGLHVEKIINAPSNPATVARLTRIGCRAHNALIDLTNYIMFEWGQPVHAYDAQKIAGQTLTCRFARKGEKLKLIDERTIELTDADLVIADTQKVLGLAGVMGGEQDSINGSTTSVFFEAASFAAGPVRRTALRHKARTESSSRFEKEVDPAWCTVAAQRFVALAKHQQLDPVINNVLMASGSLPEEKDLSISHNFLVARAGVDFSEEFIVKTLQKLGFGVSVKRENHTDITYFLRIPSWRATKDIRIDVDILEELIRFYGFERIAIELPAIKKDGSNLQPLLKMRKVKNYCAYSANMIEQQNYSYYDETFLAQIGLEVASDIQMVNPVAETNRRMAKTLFPNLFKNLVENHLSADHLAFFEMGRVWEAAGDSVNEIKKVIGLFCNKRTPVNFYEVKNKVDGLLRLFGINASYTKMTKPAHSWINAFQGAEITDGTRSIGFIAHIDPALLLKMGLLVESECCVFELDLDYLINYKPAVTKCKELPRYQGSFFDLSCVVPVTVTAARIKKDLAHLDPMVEEVSLLDFFEKEEWLDTRSLTFRVAVRRSDTTITKEEVDAVREKAISVLGAAGITLRS